MGSVPENGTSTSRPQVNVTKSEENGSRTEEEEEEEEEGNGRRPVTLSPVPAGRRTEETDRSPEREVGGASRSRSSSPLVRMRRVVEDEPPSGESPSQNEQPSDPSGESPSQNEQPSDPSGGSPSHNEQSSSSAAGSSEKQGAGSSSSSGKAILINVIRCVGIHVYRPEYT